MTVSLRDMTLFVATYEEKSFSAAAQRESATQPGVSQHIRKLEDSLHVKLFIRRANGVHPTPAGDRLYRHCIEVLRAHAHAMRSVEPYARGAHEELAVGLMPTITRWALAPALERFVDSHPNVRIHVVEGFSGLLTQQVQAGMLDFAVVPPAPETVGLRSTMLVRTPEILVSGKRAKLEHRAPVRLADFGPLKIVVPSRSNVRRLMLEHYFVSNNVQIDRLVELDAVPGSLSFVAHTDWVVVAPAIVINEHEDSRLLNVNPIFGPDIWLDLVLIERATRPMSPGAEAFFGMLVKEMNVLNRVWN